MSLPELHIYAKICKKYAKYVSMKFICIICTSHFAHVRSLPVNANGSMEPADE